MKVKSLIRIQLFTTPWTAGYQASPSMGFSRQEYWNGVPPLSPSLMFVYRNGTDFCLLILFLLSIIYPYAMLCYAKSLQSYLTLCDPIDGSPPGSAVPGILQARTLEWVAIAFSNAWKWKVKVKSLSRVWLLGTRWTAAYQAPPSMGFSRHQYWSGVPLFSPWWI